MWTGGRIFDLYDDTKGDVLKQLYPTQESVPETVKVAHLLTAEDLSRLPDDVFALVLVDNGQPLRKFACTDAGNTLLSIEYFLKHQDNLPEQAQKVAAENLLKAAEWYQLELSEEKVAGLLGKAMTAYNAIGAAKTTGAQVKQNLQAVRQYTPGTVVPPEMLKGAEATGTHVMPYQASSVPAKRKTVIKTSSPTNGALEMGTPPSKEQPESLPQAKQLKPHVDVTGVSPPVKSQEKKASRTALNGRYPLDSYEQVKTASAYFDTYRKHFPVEDRREYAVNLVKRASELGIEVSETAKAYGAPGFAKHAELRRAVDNRLSILSKEADAPLRETLEELYRARTTMSADLYCATLAEFDKVAGLDWHYDSYIMDPVVSTYGQEKKASWTFSEGGYSVTEEDLQKIAGSPEMAVLFKEAASEFQQDPVGVFESMPMPEKILICKMCRG